MVLLAALHSEGIFPSVLGHEGAGVVEAVGPGVSWLAPGDHVVFGFIPSCGRCPSCSTGHSNLCDMGALLGTGKQIADGTSRHHAQGQDISTMCLLGTFDHHTVVNEASCIKIEKDIVWLIAENEDYPPIKVTPENELIIWGIVTASIKKF